MLSLLLLGECTILWDEREQAACILHASDLQYQYDVEYRYNFLMLRIILHDSDLQYGVTIDTSHHQQCEARI